MTMREPDIPARLQAAPARTRSAPAAARARTPAAAGCPVTARSAGEELRA